MSDKSFNTEKCLKLKVKDLQERCKSRGLPVYGTKKILCQRLKYGKIKKTKAKIVKTVRSITKKPIKTIRSNTKISINTCMKMSLKQLRDICKSRGLAQYGKKEELCERIKNNRKKHVRDFKKSYDLLQFQDQFPELGIKRGDWFNDPCYLLKNIKKRIGGEWTFSNIMKLGLTLPKLNIKKTPQPGTVFRYGGDYIKMGLQIGKGSYGIVYEGKRGYKRDGKLIYNKNIAIKMLETPDINEFLNETIIHNELFCGMRGNWGKGARIPKLEFMGTYDIVGKKYYLVGMEELEGTGLHTFKTPTTLFAKQIKSIATLLDKLQKKFQFMHRDLHTGNIMYKGEKIYIIDFGMSTMKIGGNWINRHAGVYGPYDNFNPSHDLRMLTIVLLSDQLEYGNNPLLNNKLVQFNLFQASKQIPRYIDSWDKGQTFWVTYDMMHIIDDNFTPKNFINLMDKILDNPRTNAVDLPPTLPLRNYHSQLMFVDKDSNGYFKEKMNRYLRRIYKEVF